MEIKKLIVGMVQTNCYIAINPGTKEAVVVDPGDEAGRIRSEVERLGVKAQAILLTHGHVDQVMAREELRDGWGVPIYACEKEAEVLADPGKNLTGQFLGGGSALKADVLLSDQETASLAGYDFRLLHTPGHTGGSCCYYVESEKVLFSGDTLFQESYGRIDFPTGSGRQIAESIVKVLFALPDDTAVYPGHMGDTTIGDEKLYNPLASYIGRL